MKTLTQHDELLVKPYIDSKIQTLTNQVKDMNNILGAKNLIHLSVETQTVNGVTITVQDDGSIILNGTATAAIYFGLTKSGIPLESGKCILSGVSDGGPSSYRLFTATSGGATLYQEIDGQRTAIRSENGDSAIFDITKMNTGAGSSYVDPSEINISLAISNGCTCNNVLIKPMIRLASITDNTYVPYAKSNKELTEDISDLDIEDITSNFYSSLGTDVTVLSDSGVWKQGKHIFGKVIFNISNGLTADKLFSLCTLANRPAKSLNTYCIGMTQEYQPANAEILYAYLVSSSGTVQIRSNVGGATYIKLDIDYVTT